MSRKLDNLNETLALTKAGSREHTAAVVARARYDLKTTKKAKLWVSETGPGLRVLVNGNLPFVYLTTEPSNTPAIGLELVYLPESWGEGALFDAIRQGKA